MKPHWKVKFVRAGFEPPMPFGKSHAIVAANSRKEAMEIVKRAGMVSQLFPKATAIKTDDKVDWHFQWTEARAALAEGSR